VIVVGVSAHEVIAEVVDVVVDGAAVAARPKRRNGSQSLSSAVS
jgi:hypothetical protein